MFDKINKNIIEILGIDKMPVNKQKDTMEKYGSIVYQEIIFRVLEEMDDGDRITFENLVSTNPDPETMFKYISEKIPNISEIAIEEAHKIKDEQLETA